jgi:hypothetical protein
VKQSRVQHAVRVYAVRVDAVISTPGFDAGISTL